MGGPWMEERGGRGGWGPRGPRGGPRGFRGRGRNDWGRRNVSWRLERNCKQHLVNHSVSLLVSESISEGKGDMDIIRF